MFQCLRGELTYLSYFIPDTHNTDTLDLAVRTLTKVHTGLQLLQPQLIPQRRMPPRRLSSTSYMASGMTSPKIQLIQRSRSYIR